MIGKTDNETIVLKLSHEERFADEKQEVIIFWGSYTFLVRRQQQSILDQV